ncbi:MAG: recombination mediator RecR [Paludibacteraceae bacterium]|nr:recombination mediator RecR [Paludibacteraceae bacterium]
MSQNYPSALLERAVLQLNSLPGVGKKTALRYALHLLKQDEEEAQTFIDTLVQLRQGVRYCRMCHNISDTEVCSICSGINRDHHTLCVVENVQDVMQIENTGQYFGLYHVLGGIISPMDGVGPKDIEIDSLVARILPEQISEVILALPTTMEGDTTNFYIFRRLQALNSTGDEHSATPLKISQISRGIAVGGEIECTDELTLGRSIVNRIEFKI